MTFHPLTVRISLRSKFPFTDGIAQQKKNIHSLTLFSVSSTSDRAIHCKAQMDVRGVLEGGAGLMGVDELLGSWRMIGAAMTRVASTSFFGRTMCIKWAVTWRNKFSTDSPVLAETKYESMSRSLAKRWCFSALTARKCSRSPKQQQSRSRWTHHLAYFYRQPRRRAVSDWHSTYSPCDTSLRDSRNFASL